MNTNSKATSQNCQVGEIMKRCGISVAVTSLCSASGFFSAAIIPIPALKVLCIQAGLIILTILVSMLLVFPAFISLDLRRRNKGRVDFFCCLPSSVFQSDAKHSQTSSKPTFNSQSDIKRTAVTRVLSPPGRGTVTRVLCTPSSEECWVGAKPVQASSPSMESLTAESTGSLVKRPNLSREQTCGKIFNCSLKIWIRDVYSQVITRGPVKAVTILFLFLTIAASAWGVSRLKDGLDLTDIVPTGTTESEFLNSQQKYFGFYNMFAVTQGNFEYPTKQKLLHEYHEAFNRVPWIIKNDNGGLTDSWLVLFRDWLKGLQRSFDNDWERGYITEEGWKRNASDNGILAYKLLVQTGHVDHPVDTSLVSQIRLVDDEGIINPKAFYNYLTAWVSNDALAYIASQANIIPMPRFWYHERSDYDLKIPKSSPIIYAQFPFYLSDLDDTETITKMIETVRNICKKFEEKGLPNFPSGVPFTFWEQYINLRFYLLLALVTVLGTVFILLSVSLVNVWAASLVVLILATLVLQLSGLLGLFGLKLSAAPAIMLIISVGVGVEFSVHMTIGFLTALGDRNRRVRISLTHLSIPMLNGAFSTLLSISSLLFSDFDFVKQYFFVMIAALIILGALDGLLFLPVLLTLVGPPADLISKTSSDRVPKPSPPPSPQLQPHHHSYSIQSNSGRRSNLKHAQTQAQTHQQSQRRYNPTIHGSNLSLTTISEEPASNGSTNSSQRSSHEILVEPQVVVETTTFNGSHKHASGNDTSEGVIYHEVPHVTTTVTATAKVKVELHNKTLSGIADSVHKTGILPSSNSKCSNNRCANSCSSCGSPTSASTSSNNKNNRCSGGICTTSSSTSSSCSSSSSSSSDKEEKQGYLKKRII
ncbi:Protein patched, partial [Armadillidium vulgare]